MGLQLASLAQLATAQQQGLHTCTCGWLTDGAAFVTNRTDDICNIPPGINKCPEDPKVFNFPGYDAYCVSVQGSYVIS